MLAALGEHDGRGTGASPANFNAEESSYNISVNVYYQGAG